MPRTHLFHHRIVALMDIIPMIMVVIDHLIGLREATDLFQYRYHNFMPNHMRCLSNLQVFLALLLLLSANYATLQDILLHFMNPNIKRGFSAIFVVKQIIPHSIVFIMIMVQILLVLLITIQLEPITLNSLQC